MNKSNSEFNKKQEYTDGKYSVYSFSGENGKFRRLACSEESICILPFDLNEHNQIKNVYLIRYKDHLTSGSGQACITDTYNRNQFSSYFEMIEDTVKNEFGIDNCEVNDMYFLGKIKHGLPFTKEYRCYAVNLTNYASDSNGFVVPQSEDFEQIERVRFSKLLKGEVTDSLVLSCSLLLLSYFSE